jgi:hypothetical protein
MMTRRNFLTGTTGLLCGATVLPAWAGLVGDPRTDLRPVLLLSEHPDPRLPFSPREVSLEHHPLSLERAAAISHQAEGPLSVDNYSALVALGTPAAIFALRTQLGSRWRVVMRGMHGAKAARLHEIHAPASLAGSLAGAVGAARDEYDFAGNLLALDLDPRELFKQKRISRLHQAQCWADTARASLLALPGRAV